MTRIPFEVYAGRRREGRGPVFFHQESPYQPAGYGVDWGPGSKYYPRQVLAQWLFMLAGCEAGAAALQAYAVQEVPLFPYAEFAVTAAQIHDWHNRYLERNGSNAGDHGTRGR